MYLQVLFFLMNKRICIFKELNITEDIYLRPTSAKYVF